MTDYYRVGTIVKTQGLQGEVRVNPTTDFAEERFSKGSQLALFDTNNQLLQELTVSRGRSVKSQWLVRFEGLMDIQSVEKFVGCVLKVSEENLSALTEGEFYYHEIIGCSVYEGTQKIGVVTEILQPGANDVWVVKRENKKDLLLPYINSVIRDINSVEKRVIVDIPLGLDD